MNREAEAGFASTKIHVVEPSSTEILPEYQKDNLEHLVQGIRLYKLPVNPISTLSESEFKIDRRTHTRSTEQRYHKPLAWACSGQFKLLKQMPHLLSRPN